MSDLGTCPLPDLVQHFRDGSDKAVNKNDFLTCLLLNTIANRYEELLGVLRLCNREDVYHSWLAYNEKTEVEVREMIGE